VVRSSPAPARVPFRLKLAARPDASLLERLMPGGLAVGAALGVTILDRLYSVASGEVMSLAGFRASVPAGMVMLLGIVWCIYRLKRD
jgi:hypothetical protein